MRKFAAVATGAYELYEKLEPLFTAAQWISEILAYLQAGKGL